MQECNMQKPETDSKTLSAGLSPMERREKILGKVCKVPKVMRFLKEINIYDEV